MTKALSTVNEASKAGQGQDVSDHAPTPRWAIALTLMAIVVVGMVAALVAARSDASGRLASPANPIGGVDAPVPQPTWPSAAMGEKPPAGQLDLPSERPGIRRSCIVAPRAATFRMIATGLHQSCLSTPSLTTTGRSLQPGDFGAPKRDQAAVWVTATWHPLGYASTSPVTEPGFLPGTPGQRFRRAA